MKQYYSVLILIFGLQLGFGQIGFEESVIIDDSYGVQSAWAVELSDIDGDGDLDVVYTSAENMIGWSENMDGQGTFSSIKIVTELVDGPLGLHIADIDGDGDKDILSASVYDDKLAWYENLDGLGSFGPQIVISNIEEVESLYSADFDNDGDLDLVAANQVSNTIYWYENLDGLGNFFEHIIDTYTDATVVYAEDIDNDGDADIIAASSNNGSLGWFENENGLGSFGQRQGIVNSLNYPQTIHVSDLDGDDNLDILVASLFDSKIAWFKNLNNSGDFGPQQNISTSAIGATSSYGFDYDNDGDLDVISSTSNGNTVSWYENTDGLGNFSAQNIISDNIKYARMAKVGDIDNDGYLDVVSTSQNWGEVKWYRNLNGQGQFEFAENVAGSANGASDVFVADIDGDGNLDILSSSRDDSKIAWYKNFNSAQYFGALDGVFSDRQRIISQEATAASSVFASDVDNDGDLDVLSSSKNDDKIAWYENIDGLGNFSEQLIISSELDMAHSVLTADIDNDGDLDILAGGFTEVVWYENLDGLGGFGGSQFIGNSTEITDVFASDIDSDGDIDVVYSSRQPSTVFWRENVDGLGDFSSAQLVSDPSTFAAYSVYCEDIDEDGFTDVVAASSNDVVWYKNLNGNGDFGEMQLIYDDSISSTTTDTTSSVKVSDIDGDGDLDVLTSFIENDNIAWYENNGAGGFGEQQLISQNSERPTSVFLADINNDGYEDVVSSSSNDNKIAFYLNSGLDSNLIFGNIAIDINSNGCSDFNVTNLNGVMVSTTNGVEDKATFTLNNGDYNLLLSSDGEYTTSLGNQIPNYFISAPDEAISNFTGLGNQDENNYCIQPIGAINDIEIGIYPITEARPGFEVAYEIVYKNIGTTVINDGFITLDYDNNKINFQNSNQIPFLETTNSLAFDYTDLQPFEVRTINLDFSVYTIPQVSLGDILNFDVEITPFTQDLTPSNNSFTLQQTVIGSYDPNDITVLEGDEIFIEDADKYLHYLIRFQNTGTASAINVRVEHILDDKLDWTTMQLESLSHTGRVEIENQTDVSFIFNNINLPDSTSDEPNSHGYIAFKIKPKSNVQVGDIISGVADIYFDFNPPIITNTVNTEIAEPLSIDEVSAETIKLYPNPAKDTIQITSNQVIEALTVFDINGRELQSLEISTTDYNLDISNLSKGVYFIELLSGESKFIEKFIKN